MNQKYTVLSISLVLTLLSACSNTKDIKPAAIANDVSVTKVADRKSIAPDTTTAPEITASVTLNKAEILGKDFFYGADLQYSSIYDKVYDLYTQSEAMGHIPAYFRVNGSELQLLADNRRLFPSDVNHPEQLISRFKVLSETADTITVSEGDASAYIVSMIDTKADSPKDHWARSFQFVKEGNYLLQESSVVLPDGTVAEMMESIFPKETLALSPSFQTFQMDDSNAGAATGPANRYRMLNGEQIFKGEDKMSFAQHFDLNDAVTGAPKTIDWYVTPNIKDEHLPVVKQAVEGWNRYFRLMAGVKRDVVLFKGRVPDGVKLGDPRYNIINWDSRLVAGAAYESQATDPFTGKQSHSVIYMPVAWFQIGMNYWTNGTYSENAGTPALSAKTLGRNSKFKVSCARDLSGAAAALGSGRMSQQDADKFSIQLMKQTLFHEVGHSLGLAHNFKGSLTFDRKDPKSMFSSSIMDYNDYEIERAAFTDPMTADGPLLEYDRQALSAIYNKMADVQASDKVMPACNDAEADTEASGAVDPLCIRYDIEKDPTLSVDTALNRVNSEKLEGDVTLVEALDNVTEQVLSADALKKVATADDASALMKKYTTALKGVMNFYFVAGKASISKTVRTNVKSLYVFEDGVLPAGYVEKDMRERAFKGLDASLAMTKLPAIVTKKLAALAVTANAAIQKTGYGASIKGDTITKLGSDFETDGTNGLLKMRSMIIATLANISTLPLYFGTGMDFETAITTSLYEMTVDKTRLSDERLASATALNTYKDRLNANALRTKASAKLDEELATVKDNDARELAIALKAALAD